MTNDSAQANLARLQQESPELDEAKQVEVKVKNVKAEVDEIMEKKKVGYFCILRLCCPVYVNEMVFNQA